MTRRDVAARLISLAKWLDPGIISENRPRCGGENGFGRCMMFHGHRGDHVWPHPVFAAVTN